MILHTYRCAGCGSEYSVPRDGDPTHCDNETAVRVYKPFRIGAGALPNKRGPLSQIGDKDRQLEQNLAAYKRLRKEGHQPPSIDEAAAIEKLAEYPQHVAMGSKARMRDPQTGEKRWIKPAAFEAFGETFGHSHDTPAPKNE